MISEEINPIGTKAEKALLSICETGRIENWNGHFKRGSNFYGEGWWRSASERLKDIFIERYRWETENHCKNLLEIIEKGEPLETPFLLKAWEFERHYPCPFCGEELKLGFDGKNLCIISEGPCPNPNGLITEFELNVPSGKIVVDDDLREWFPFDEHSINPTYGKHLQTLEAIEVGLAYGFVGNTSPGVYKDGDKFTIASCPEEDIEERGEKAFSPFGERVAGVCTDLWWYSICDFDEFEKRRKHFTPDLTLDKFLTWEKSIVSVKPGVYKFRQEQGVSGEYTENTVWATFEWVRDPDPIKNYLQEDIDQHCNATEFLIQSCLNWPTLYMPQRSKGYESYEDRLSWTELSSEQKLHALARAADQTMCVLGGGIEWHEKGFPRGKISEKARKYAEEYGEIPLFDFKTHWYPISEGYGGICLGAGLDGKYDKAIMLELSFVRLGLNICQNYIKYGEDPCCNHEVYPPAFEISFCRERMKLFAKCYEGLRSRYPSIVLDENFDEWFKTSIEDHIKNFDFGPNHPPETSWGNPPLSIKKGNYFEFDANLLNEGHFCWHPSYMKGAASKKDAQMYSLHILGNTQSPMGHLHFKTSSAVDSIIPLYVVGRVVRGVGEGYNSKELEIAFDYGTFNMTAERWSISEKDMKAVRQFNDKEEYKKLLEKAKKYFQDLEDRVNNPKDPCFQFTSCKVTRCVKETNRYLENDVLVDGETTLKMEFYPKSKDINGVKGYSHLFKIHISKEDPTFSSHFNEIQPYGWKILKNSIRVFVTVGPYTYFATFRLNSHTGKMTKKVTWKGVSYQQLTKLKVLPLHGENRILQKDL